MAIMRSKRPILRAQIAAMNPASNPDPAPWGIPTTLEWLPATFLNGAPSPTTRRWIKLVSPIGSNAPFWPGFPGLPVPGVPPGVPVPGVPGPARRTRPGQSIGMYEAILFKNFGASQENVTAKARSFPLPNGGSRVEAAVTTPIPANFPGAPARPGQLGLAAQQQAQRVRSRRR